MHPRLGLVVVIAIAAFWRAHTATTTVVIVLPRKDVAPLNSRPTREQWAVDFLGRLGNPQPSAEAIEMVVEWTLAEDDCLSTCQDGHIAAFERHNPLNTTQPSLMETLTINDDGVRGYATRQAGIDAAVQTVTNGLYDDVVRALQANDSGRAKQALWASPWAGSHYGYGSAWPTYTIQQEAPDAVPPNYQLVSNPISADTSAFGVNVRAALNARNGALRHVIIRPGETWSFNAAIGDPEALTLATIVHPGDGWCNLAARYAQVARAAGLIVRFQDHGVGDLGGGVENSVAIWNVGGLSGTTDGRQDLELTNPTDHIVTLEAIEQGLQVFIVATS